jgi:hypothetical protein
MEPMIVTAQPPRKEPISAWRKILAILLTVALLPLTMLALAVSLVVCAVPLASGAGLGSCGVYLNRLWELLSWAIYPIS